MTASRSARTRPRGGGRLQTSLRSAVGPNYPGPVLPLFLLRQSAYLTVRPATETDQVAIRALVRSERLNPYGLDWPNFLVAVGRGGLVGAVQLRRHRDGSRELGSLVVRQEARRQGIASRLINTLLAGANERVLLITTEAFASRYERWGFRQIEPAAAPAAGSAQLPNRKPGKRYRTIQTGASADS